MKDKCIKAIDLPSTKGKIVDKKKTKVIVYPSAEVSCLAGTHSAMAKGNKDCPILCCIPIKTQQTANIPKEFIIGKSKKKIPLVKNPNPCNVDRVITLLTKFRSITKPIIALQTVSVIAIIDIRIAAFSFCILISNA